MTYKLGISAYVSTFDQYLDWYEKFDGSQTMVFTSMHIAEEFDEQFESRAVEMLTWFKERGFYLIVDLSPRALEYLGLTSLDEFVNRFGIDNIRLDFGFEAEDLRAMSARPDLTFNASQQDLFHDLRAEGIASNYFMMHNFYPRPETGIDSDYFENLNSQLAEVGQEPIVFIAGDEVRRGPLFEGLPTLESQRYLPSYVQFVQMARLYDMSHIFIGDIKISDQSLSLIQDFIADEVITIPVHLSSDYRQLLGMTFSVRVDSPKNIWRLVESRTYHPREDWLKPAMQTARLAGAITLDNELYQRKARYQV